MKNLDSKNTYDPLYFFGDSEAGKAARQVDWATHPLGEPQEWSVSLKTTLGILFNARQAMFLFWGPEKFGFYNDAQIPILGLVRHPHVMGKTGLEIWPDVWEEFALPQINIAMMGQSTWTENQLIPILRSRQMDDGYFSYGYSPVYVEDGSVGGAIVTCTETTGKVLAEKNLKENEEQLKITLATVTKAEQKVVDVLESMSDGFISLDKDFKVLRVNRIQEQISRLDRSQTVGKNHWDIWPKESIPKIWEAYHKVIIERVPVRIEDFNSALNIWIAVDAFPTSENGIAAFFTDITERKTAQIDYERSVDVSPAILWISEKDGSCTYLSKQWYEFTGQTPEQALGFGWLDATHPDDKDRASAAFLEANKKITSFSIEYRLKTKTGEYRWAIDAGNPRYDVNGNYLGYAGTVLDINDLVVERQKLEKAEKQIKLESHKLEMIFKESPASMALMRGHELVFEKVNPKYQANFTDRKLVGLPFVEACPEFVEMPFVGLLKRVFQTGEPYVVVEEYVPLRPKQDGPIEDRYYDFSYHRIDDADGKPYGVYNYAIEVTERVKSQLLIKESEDKLHFALENAQLGSWTINLATSQIVTSEQTKKIFGVDEFDENVFEIINSRMHPDDITEIERVLNNAISQNKIYNHEYRIILPKTNEVRWVHSQGRARYDQEKKPVELTGIIVDITDRKMVEAEITKAKEEAERANQMKSAFLANMSHEIRTPLGAIIGFSTLLKESNIDSAEKDRYLDTIVRNGNSLTTIIDDILDLAKIEAGKLDIESIPLSLYTLATDVVDMFKDKTREKSIYLFLNVDEAVPSQICTDPTRLRQILVNLIGNAVKFTEKGGIRVNVRAAPLDCNRIKIIVDVKDTGIGLTEKQKEKLFTPFNQADNSMTRKFGGTGLGLALSQRLSHALLGEISIVSGKPGEGCVFNLTFEASLTSKAPVRIKDSAAGAKAGSLKGLKVLIVDDSIDNQYLVERMLTKNGATVDTAHDGDEGVTKALSGSFDVVLMDIQMPKLDGYQAKAALDKRGYEKPVIALTAHAMSDERLKTKAAGFAGHLTKPLNAAELVKTLASFSRS